MPPCEANSPDSAALETAGTSPAPAGTADGSTGTVGSSKAGLAPAQADRKVAVRVVGAEVHYGAHLALAKVDLDVYEGDFLCLLGPSGCGKTTLLNIISGFIQPTAGYVEANGVEVSGPSPDRGMVFQEYALFPWLTVAKNIQYGPRLKGMRSAELKELSDRYCRLVGLENFADMYPNQLSGGMRQRAAIARALANQPDILLMDEPFGALDAMTRQTLQEELLKIWEAERKTLIFVTHSITEAVFMSDRIAIMSLHPGRVRHVIANTIRRPRSRTSEEHFAMCRVVETMFQEDAANKPDAPPGR